MIELKEYKGADKKIRLKTFEELKRYNFDGKTLEEYKEDYERKLKLMEEEIEEEKKRLRILVIEYKNKILEIEENAKNKIMKIVKKEKMNIEPYIIDKKMYEQCDRNILEMNMKNYINSEFLTKVEGEKIVIKPKKNYYYCLVEE